MGKRGPQPVAPEALYAFAHQLYWDLRRLSEGGLRWWADEKKYKQLAEEIDKAGAELSEQQKASCLEAVEEEIRTGCLREDPKKARLRELEDGLVFATEDLLHLGAAMEARIQKKIPGEPDVIDKLLRARTPERVRRICEDAFMRVNREVKPGVIREVLVQNWPIPLGSILPHYLARHAEEFVAAKKDPRFPRSSRPSNQLKQLWFLSRALAGAIYGVKTRTAINLVGSMRPDEMFHESRDGKPARKQRKAKQITTRRH